MLMSFHSLVLLLYTISFTITLAIFLTHSPCLSCWHHWKRLKTKNWLENKLFRNIRNWIKGPCYYDSLSALIGTYESGFFSIILGDVKFKYTVKRTMALLKFQTTLKQFFLHKHKVACTHERIIKQIRKCRTSWQQNCIV